MARILFELRNLKKTKTISLAVSQINVVCPEDCKYRGNEAVDVQSSAEDSRGLSG